MKWKFLPTRKTEKDKPKKTKTREWLEAILFAVVVSTIIRGLLFSAYAIPSGSMESTQFPGDYLFVSKISYGPRMPFTPVQIPFLESTVTEKKIKTYWDGIKLPYYRLPGLTEVKKGDIVVFNTPEEADPALNKEVDVRTNLIKRCLATAGDVLTIVNGKAYINGKPAPVPEKEQTSFYVVTDGNSLNPQLLKELNIEIMQQSDIDKYVMVIPTAHLSAIKSIQSVKTIIPIIEPAGNYDASVFPHNERFKWNQDNYGPLKIPQKGMSIALNDSTLTLYRRAIELYEKNKLEIRDGKVWINGQQTNSYTFKMNYYWMMGDNRHRSHDSRFWGYVPEDHIVGKAKITWLSIDSTENLLSKIRWDRFMKPIK